MTEPKNQGQWSPQQWDAIWRAQSWLANPQGQQVFRIWGWAGTGKTTLARHLAAGVRGPVVYGSFTGKAALVMRNAGCWGASTLHSLLYQTRQNPNTGEWITHPRDDSPIKTADLVVVDEVSMVGPGLGDDLLDHGRPVLVLGDPGQLPPINGVSQLTGVSPDVQLTEIHRQALNSPVTQLAHRVRTGQPVYPGTWGSSAIIPRGHLTEEELDVVLVNADAVLVGTNATRITMNQRIRRARGLTTNPDWMPVPGDQLVCLKNSRRWNLINGATWTVVQARRINNGLIELELNPGDGTDVTERFRVPQEWFQGRENQLTPERRERYPEFTWGWALTVHKAQGSQWPRVVVFDESRVFRDKRNQWLYTAVTRASESVTLIT